MDTQNERFETVVHTIHIHLSADVGYPNENSAYFSIWDIWGQLTIGLVTPDTGALRKSSERMGCF